MILTGLSGHAWAWAARLDRAIKPMLANVLSMGHLPIRSALMDRESADALTDWESAAYPVRIVPATAWDQKKPFPTSTLDRVRRSDDVVP